MVNAFICHKPTICNSWKYNLKKEHNMMMLSIHLLINNMNSKLFNCKISLTKSMKCMHVEFDCLCVIVR